jgi:hypothetical protein
MPDRENEIIALVTYIHNRVGFRDPPFSLLDFCAAFPAYDLQPADLPRGFNGEILVKGPVRIVRYRTGSKPSTNRFAIGHEIGHGFLHEDQEFQCKDFFSSELLMPLPVLNRMADDQARASATERQTEIARLSDVFGVTRATMKSRLDDLTRLREWEGEFL